ncbi:uncharacterized protein LOC134251555 [Saccostrea cucullata]|uniref:uncharacterized protein LOC134251555 n=1 Tax=Saccostrea cuccullata TaxID=36930 RepID=UPI002ED14173
MVIIISTVFAVGGTLLVVIIVVVFFCLKQRTAAAKGEESKTRAGKLHTINEKNKDLNSNYKQSQKFKHSTHSGRKINEGTGLNQKHPHNDIWYGGRMPTGVEFSRSKKYHQQNYFSRNQHHYRNQNSAYCLPYTDPRNVMYYQRYPGSEYSEDMSGYSREGPYRMQQFYPQSYPRQDRYTEDGLERRIGHRRGDYGGYWDNDTLY